MSHNELDSQRAEARARSSARKRIDSTHCDGVVWFGNVDWWYHNRGHASVRMATRIARRIPTVWMNSIGMRMPLPGKTEIAWSRYARKLKSLVRGLKRDAATGMWIYSPVFVPKYSARGIELNGALLAMQTRMVLKRIGSRRPSTCVSMPTMVAAAERLPWVRVVFDRCDDFTTLPEADAALIGGLERRLLDLSDHAAYVSLDLLERERGLVAGAEFIGHGVDFDQLTSARPLEGPLPPAPESMRSLARPIVGFYGGMDDYRMDAELMIQIARHIAPATFVLIGPEQMDLSRVKAEPNVRHIGQMAPEELASHAAHFDIGVIPFLRNEFNRLCNPTKLKEYLALGFPIVASELPAFEKYGDLISTARSHEEFLLAIDAALADRDLDRARRRRAAVSGDDWDRVALRVARMLAVPGIEVELGGDGNGVSTPR